MTFFKKTLMAAGMASLTLSPIAASAATPVAVRAAPASADESELRANGSGLILALVALAALTAAYFLIEDNNNGDNRPVSP